MAIDLNAPLEVNRSGRDYRNLRNPLIEGDRIRITYEDSDGDTEYEYFDATSGVRTVDRNNDNPIRLRNTSPETAVKYYRIWFGKQEAAKSDWRYLGDDALYQFLDGKTAAQQAKALNAEATTAGSPFRFMVKSHTVMSANHQWREWMQARVDSGEYVLFAWQNEEWYNKDHFAHAAIADPFKVAYVESDVAGADDRMTVVNPGRYLERFYSDKLSPQEIAAWAAKADSEAELCFATTPDEIEDIYVNSGINSCMQYPANDSHFPLGIQPTRIYGAGDLALAYLKRRDKIVARALVWPDRKVCGRIYGDVERLKNRLVGEGYKYKDGDASAFHGARMLHIKDGDIVVLPYLDWNLGAKVLDSDYLVMVDKSQGKATWGGQTQNGTATGESIQICGHNGCRTRMNGSTGFYNASTGRQMCDPCAEQTLVRCVLSNNFYDPANSNGYRISQIMNRSGAPLTGLRGGWARHDYARENHLYRMINDVVYLASETEVVPGRTRVYRPIPA